MTHLQKWAVLSFFSLATTFCVAAPTTTPQKGSGPQQAGPMNPSGSMNQMGDCSQLSSDEQEFATQLGSANKMMFCNKFNDDQRQSAMDMSGQMGSDGNLITNDQAVEKIAKDNNMMMGGAKPGAGTRPGGSCPVK